MSAQAELLNLPRCWYQGCDARMIKSYGIYTSFNPVAPVTYARIHLPRVVANLANVGMASTAGRPRGLEC